MKLELRDVSKRYASGGVEVSVLSGVFLTVPAGESIAIVGPSGCGKSTLLQIIGTLSPPSSGNVWLDGRDLATLKEDARAEVRRRDLGFVFQSHHLLPHCTALENVLVPLLANGGRTPPEATDRARDLLGKMGLSDRLRHRPSQLSVGECQRVAVARALIQKPKLLLADEPTGSLDRTAASSLGDLISQLAITRVVVTHSEALAGQMQHVYRLDRGRLERDR
jgi:lipoprotein-releasing system ATP-binding protein